MPGATIEDRETPPIARKVSLRLAGQALLVLADGSGQRLERRDAAMLAVLVLEGPQSRISLARWLWPDVADAAALRNLRQRVFRFKRAAGRALVDGQTSLQLAADIGHDLDPAAAAAADAGSIELLSTCDYGDCDGVADRIDGLRRRWRRACADAAEDAAQRATREQAAPIALRWAERAVAIEPSSERAWRRLIELHHAAGDVGRALMAFGRCCAALDTIGLTPGSDTRHLAEQLRQAQPIAATATVPHLSLARPPRLVGRAKEWARITDALQRGRLVVLRGEPGIGKTRLATELLRSAGPFVSVKAGIDRQQEPYELLTRLWSAAAPGASSAGAWAAAQLDRLRTGDTEVDKPPLQDRHLVQAVQQVLTEWPASRLGGLLIDDLQWADAASLEVFFGALQTTPARPPMILALRSDEGCAALDAWLDAGHGQAVLDLRLGPLSEQGVIELIDTLELPQDVPSTSAATARALMKSVGGHPFRILELLRARTRGPQADAAPASVDLLEALQRRVARLAAGPLRLLRLAALAGGDFSAELAAEVLGLHAIDLVDDWNVLVAAQFMQEAGTVFDVVVEAVRVGVPAPIAEVLHGQLAASGERRGLGAVRVAEHWRAAACWAEAGAAYTRAAERATTLARPTEALALWDLAATCFERGGDRRAQWLAERSAVDAAATAAGAREWVQRAERLVAGAAAGSLEQAQAFSLFGTALTQIEPRPDRGCVVLRQGLEAAHALLDEPLELEIAGRLAWALTHKGDIAQALGLAQAYGPIAERHAPSPGACAFFSGVGVALFNAGHYPESAASTQRALEIALECRRLDWALREAGNLIPACRSIGDLAAASRHATHAQSLWRQLDEPRSTSSLSVVVNIASIDVDVGRFDRAIELAMLAREHFVATGSEDWCAVAEARLFNAYYRLGQFARARQCLSPMPTDASANRRVGRLMQLCKLDAAAGRSVALRLEEAVDRDAPELFARNRLLLRLQWAEALPPDEALPVEQAVLADVIAWSDATMVAVVHAQLARTQLALGHLDPAADHARQAWLAAQSHAPFGAYHVEFCWRVHEAAQQAGHHDLAHEALSSGACWIERALPHVPPSFLHSFRYRNPANRLLLARAANLKG